MNRSANGGKGSELLGLALQVVALAETVARQAEAIRLLADRLSALEASQEPHAEAEPTHYLNGKPTF